VIHLSTLFRLAVVFFAANALVAGAPAGYTSSPARRYVITASGPVTVTLPVGAQQGDNWYRAASGDWRKLTNVERRGKLLTFTLSPQKLQGGGATVLLNKPDWLNLRDETPPRIVSVAVDGKPVKPTDKLDLGWIERPP